MKADVEKAALERIRCAFEIEAAAVMHEKSIIKPGLIIRAAKMLMNAPRIGASGCGHSGIACRHFVHLMCCIDRSARFLSPSEANHGAMGFLQKGDVMLLNSRGGMTNELLPLLDICKTKKVSIITLTENTESTLARNADIVIPFSVEKETDKYNCQGTASFTVQCVIFDVIQAAIIELSDFANKNFALNHPGGAVGKRLADKRV
ncbi:SIS domain-containing protein [Treponema sp. OMZ 840]|uniref:SIS domain-containing protein n=1 Tax=Treponema sp. OMZ 840 TaxID=244313 RepID=UPI003D93F2D8